MRALKVLHLERNLARYRRAMTIEFEWYREKAEQNFRQHGVSFYEARSVFGDPLSLTIPTLIIQTPSAVLSISAGVVFIGSSWYRTQNVTTEFESSAHAFQHALS